MGTYVWKWNSLGARWCEGPHADISHCREQGVKWGCVEGKSGHKGVGTFWQIFSWELTNLFKRVEPYHVKILEVPYPHCGLHWLLDFLNLKCRLDFPLLNCSIHYIYLVDIGFLRLGSWNPQQGFELWWFTEECTSETFLRKVGKWDRERARAQEGYGLKGSVAYPHLQRRATEIIKITRILSLCNARGSQLSFSFWQWQMKTKRIDSFSPIDPGVTLGENTEAVQTEWWAQLGPGRKEKKFRQDL